MPSSAIDPAHVLFVLDPDEPPAVARLYKPAESFPPDLLSWLGDAKRRVDQPAGSLGFIGILPDLDAALLDEPRRTRLKKLIEEDIGPNVSATKPTPIRLPKKGQR